MLKRRDFTFSELLRHEEAMQAPLFPGLENEEQLPLFSDLGEEVFIPKPEKEYPPTHFMDIADNADSVRTVPVARIRPSIQR